MATVNIAELEAILQQKDVAVDIRPNGEVYVRNHAKQPDGVDALVLPAITDLKESWYGMEIDKKKYAIALEDETEDSVYLKIVKIQQEKE